jgi:hypothetical protein
VPERIARLNVRDPQRLHIAQINGEGNQRSEFLGRVLAGLTA